MEELNTPVSCFALLTSESTSSKDGAIIRPGAAEAVAEKVRQEIVDAALCLPAHPDKHPIDKYKTNNDGTWRALEIQHYRIS